MADTTPIGTVLTAFNNTFIKTDPYYVKNLNLWRHILVSPDSPDVTRLSGLQPIVVQQQEVNKSINVSFTITGLPSVVGLTGQSQAFAVLGQPVSSFQGFAPKSQTIKTELPVRQVKSNAATVLYFDIKALQPSKLGVEGNRYAPYGSRKNKISLKAYNGSNGVNIVSDPPMVDQVIGDTATFSFDITKLPKV